MQLVATDIAEDARLDLTGKPETDKDKAETMRTLWVPGVNNLGGQGRWAYAEFKDVWTIRTEFGAKVEAWLDKIAGEHN